LKLVLTPRTFAFNDDADRICEEKSVICHRERGVILSVPNDNVCFSTSMKWAINHTTANRKAFGENLSQVYALNFFSVAANKTRMFAGC
jgi:hypothetical protein